MSRAELITRIEQRAAAAGIDATALAPKLADYVELLGRWNRRINLTAYELEPPPDEALDRLIVEPLVAARQVRAEDRTAIDVGSGGGSPAIPLAIASPALRLTLVESRARKAAFLREVARQLSLKNVQVENCRLEELPRPDGGGVDLVTLRAVRADESLWRAVSVLLKPGSRVFWFASGATAPPARAGLVVEFELDLIPNSGSKLLILKVKSK